MSICRLCLHDRKLCKSHIVPEFLYSPLYDSDREMMAITGRGRQGWKPLNKGIWEHLLCSDCEQYLNREYEQPFQDQWAGDDALPRQMTKDDVHTATFSYVSFKLFHLSILFRASVSSNPMFQAIRLGMHEDRIRKMLLGKMLDINGSIRFLLSR